MWGFKGKKGLDLYPSLLTEEIYSQRRRLWVSISYWALKKNEFTVFLKWSETIWSWFCITSFCLPTYLWSKDVSPYIPVICLLSDQQPLKRERWVFCPKIIKQGFNTSRHQGESCFLQQVGLFSFSSRKAERMLEMYNVLGTERQYLWIKEEMNGIKD